jgi:hypothetical protein
MTTPHLTTNDKTISHGSLQDDLAVRNTLSQYCIALDTKNFDLLHDVFTADVIANYPFNPNLTGVKAVKDAIQNRLGPIKTWHGLTTQRIVFESPSKAEAATYFTGAHFGQGPHEGKVLNAYGRYEDELVQSGGKWLISERKVVFTARIGDEKIMSEF